MPDVLPPEIRELLDAKLDTLEKVELVLAVRDGAGSLSVDACAQHLQVGREVLRRVASDVAAAGMIELDGDVLRLRAAEDEPVLARIADVYEQDRSQLIRMLTSIAMDRLRGSAARTFADAFRFRKKGDR